MSEKAEIVSIKLHEGAEREWRVEFRVPNSSLEITRLMITVDPTRRPERGPEEQKSISDVIDEAHRSLANGLLRVLKSAIEAVPDEGKWDKVVKEFQAVSADALRAPDES